MEQAFIGSQSFPLRVVLQSAALPLFSFPQLAAEDDQRLRLLDVKAEIILVGKALSQLRCWPPARELGTVIIHISCGCSSSRKEGSAETLLECLHTEKLPYLFPL